MSLYNVMVEVVVPNPTGGAPTRYLDTRQEEAASSEVRDGTLYLYNVKGDEITYYSKYYWRKCERIE